MRSVARAERRRRLLTDRMSRAGTPAQRVAAASDYARQVVARLPAAAGTRLAGELCRLLIDTARQAEREEIQK